MGFHEPRLRPAVIATATCILMAGCGEQEPGSAPESALPDRGEDKLISETLPPERRDSDPTPQSGTGGTIPGYDPAERPVVDGSAPDPAGAAE